MSYGGQAVIEASADAIVDVLTDVGALASWNPAFGTIEGAGSAAVGQEFRTRVRGLVPASIRFTAISAVEVRYELHAPGVRERGVWRLRPSPAPESGTIVGHEFTHTGVVLAIMRRAFQSVASWRLARLRQEVMRRRAPQPRGFSRSS
ncbi:SRPBCC family protein [Microbacterium sp. NPDC006705]|uniref:SRPBCC family protein n=1 Tax=Microbacterium TaxID=33882 RepID=UPI00249DD182|nr:MULTISPECIES: SRPBCC family protein [Microbacterium]WHE35041.1 SRPBCC family protein [Microbacterium sp. BDGP8]WRK16204.1 SRPBCC family protein [Microbacterium plantarum]